MFNSIASKIICTFVYNYKKSNLKFTYKNYRFSIVANIFKANSRLKTLFLLCVFYLKLDCNINNVSSKIKANTTLYLLLWMKIIVITIMTIVNR